MPQDVLIITRNHPPLVGGMEKLMQHAVQALAEDYRCTVIGPRGSGRFIPGPHQAIECDESSVPGFLWQAARAALRVTRQKRVKLVVLGSGLPAPVGRLLQLRRGLPVLVFLHGLDIIAASRIYQWFWLPCLRRADLVVANSANTLALARQRGIRQAGNTVIHPGVELPDKAAAANSSFLAAFDGMPLLLSVGRLVRRKGLGPFIERCLPGLLQQFPTLKFLVIGEEPGGALKRDSGLQQELTATVARLGLGDSVVFHGRGDDDEVRAAYQRADLFVFPLVDVPGDVEGFGMVAAEAAAEGTPTIAFDCGGVSDAVIDGETGLLVPPGDYSAFEQAISKALAERSKERMKDNCLAHAQRLSWPHYARRLRAFVKDALQESR